jgi:SAM-dependent methyltransferase
MFWAKARKTYPNVSADDPDIRTFKELSNEFQKDVYKGIAGAIQDAGHRWIADRTRECDGRVLEIGFGAGRHTHFYSGDPANYFVSEYSSAHVDSEIWRAARGRSLRCDARELPFADATFQTAISVYNLEHITELSSVFLEVHRVLKRGGRFLVALPCEGGFAWNLGRELTTRRFFQKKFGINYDKVIAYEHVWSFDEIVSQLRESGLFAFQTRRFFPMLVPSLNLNLVGCLECVRQNISR